MSQSPKVLLFDLGGVIVQWVGVEALMTLKNLSRDTVLARFKNNPAFGAYETGHCSDDAFSSAMIADFDLDMSVEAFKQLWQSWVKDVYGGIEHVLPALREKYTLACLSNTNNLHWVHLNSYFECHNFFHYSFASHEIHLAKPDPLVYHYVCSEMDVEPADVMFFDDTEANLITAEALGMQVFQVDPNEGVWPCLLQQGIIERDFWWRPSNYFERV